tara:strand:+ start:2954 stop:3703 length:750 start_codon:yes stop_codon:yes gene_type:complete
LRFFLDFSYNGQHFHGWQRQINAISVQQTIEDCISIIQGDKTSISGAGRTDSGVHAKQMIAHLDLKELKLDIKDLIFKLNLLLPKTINIHNIIPVKEDAHARFDAISRTYKYYICDVKNPFYYPYRYYLREKLNLKKMNIAAKILIGKKNFKCFCKKSNNIMNYECIVKEAFWKKTKKGAVFTITSNRFLRNMVRSIVGTLIEIGIEKRSVTDLAEIIKSKNRDNAGYSVPAGGLFLTKIVYPKSIFIK